MWLWNQLHTFGFTIILDMKNMSKNLALFLRCDLTSKSMTCYASNTQSSKKLGLVYFSDGDQCPKIWVFFGYLKCKINQRIRLNTNNLLPFSRICKLFKKPKLVYPTTEYISIIPVINWMVVLSYKVRPAFFGISVTLFEKL